ncbi:MAG: NUDIX domain-containing protein [Burkholderiales bacterium]|jgi:8-oxo-dGTP pyrophosphatase MutT (NUDIX family)|nr:NUDIX domain-containing protein [Burkholderiales bacterium]
MSFRSTARPPDPRQRSAGVVVARRGVAGPWQLLLLRAFRHWDFPKGRIEPGEAPLEAARRETREEAGLTDLDFRWGQASVETELYGKAKIAQYFVAESARDPVILGISPELGRPEHHEHRWCSFDEAMVLTVPRLQRVVVWARARITGDDRGR